MGLRFVDKQDWNALLNAIGNAKALIDQQLFFLVIDQWPFVLRTNKTTYAKSTTIPRTFLDQPTLCWVLV